MLTEILKKYKNTFFPIMGIALNDQNSIPLDLSTENSTLMVLDLAKDKMLKKYIFDKLKASNVSFGYGGYGENRMIYNRSRMFKQDIENVRCIHLGIDIWNEVGTPIYAPIDGTVHSFQYNAGHLDYGATIILEHELDNVSFYTLYGHLNLASLKGLSKGQTIEKGSLLAHFGDYPENGGWPPHLHFQLVTDMLGHEGDFIGVASKREADYYLNICPNPIDLILDLK